MRRAADAARLALARLALARLALTVALLLGFHLGCSVALAQGDVSRPGGSVAGSDLRGLCPHDRARQTRSSSGSGTMRSASAIDAAGMDLVYNWGIFSFEQPNFLPRFLRGDMLYWVEAFARRRRSSRRPTRSWNRRSPSRSSPSPRRSATAIAALVVENQPDANGSSIATTTTSTTAPRASGTPSMPCSVGPSGAPRTPCMTTEWTYRDPSRCASSTPDGLAQAGIDLALGAPRRHRPMTAWEAMFIPMRLQRVPARRHRCPARTGTLVPLVASEEILFEATRAPERKDVPRLAGTAFLFGLAIADAAARAAGGRAAGPIRRHAAGDGLQPGTPERSASSAGSSSHVARVGSTSSGTQQPEPVLRAVVVAGGDRAGAVRARGTHVARPSPDAGPPVHRARDPRRLGGGRDAPRPAARSPPFLLRCSSRRISWSCAWSSRAAGGDEAGSGSGSRPGSAPDRRGPVGARRRGRRRRARSPTAPRSLDDGVVRAWQGAHHAGGPGHGVVAALTALGEPAARDVARIVHGTTVVTNMLLERRGARVVLCATDGATDLLELRRQERASLYDLAAQHPPPLVARRAGRRRRTNAAPPRASSERADPYRGAAWSQTRPSRSRPTSWRLAPACVRRPRARAVQLAEAFRAAPGARHRRARQRRPPRDPGVRAHRDRGRRGIRAARRATVPRAARRPAARQRDSPRPP